MPHALNIRDIGKDRKTALNREARLRGTTVSNLVRTFIDAGLKRTEAERAQAAWVASARQGLAEEAARIEATASGAPPPLRS